MQGRITAWSQDIVMQIINTNNKKGLKCFLVAYQWLSYSPYVLYSKIKLFFSHFRQSLSLCNALHEKLCMENHIPWLTTTSLPYHFILSISKHPLSPSPHHSSLDSRETSSYCSELNPSSKTPCSAHLHSPPMQSPQKETGQKTQQPPKGMRDA